MLRRHFELRALGRVAGITQILLHLRKQELRRGWLVDRMTVAANNIRFGMWRAPDVSLRNVLRMKTEDREKVDGHLRKRNGLNNAPRDRPSFVYLA